MKISVSYANHLITLIRKQGEFSLTHLNINFDEAVLENESNLLSFTEIQPLIEKLKELYPNQCIGLYVGHRQTLSTWGRAGFAIMTSKTLYDAISVGLKYHRSTAMLVNIRCNFMDTEHSEVLFTPIENHEEFFQFCFESTASSLLSIYTQLSKERIEILNVDISYEISDKKKNEYEKYFNCSINSNCSVTAVHFKLPKNIDMALFDQANSKMFLQQLIEREEEIKSDNLVYIIKNKISKGSGQFLSQSQMATELNISTSLLAKRLDEEKISYREILASEKEKIATKHLKTSHNMKLYEVAFLSGYSDLSSFRKAFLRWKGISPSDFKKRHTS